MNLLQLPSSDQPRNKLHQHGPRTLTDSELLALILGKGIQFKNAKDLATDVLVHYNDDLHRLFCASKADLQHFRGIGPAKASILLACFELGRRMSAQIPTRGDIVKNSKDVYNYVRKSFSMLPHEEFLILLMNNNNEIIHAHRLSRGGITGTVADGRILFKIALDFKATAIILCHNHPSGNPKPSEQDIRLTKNYRKFGQYIELPILDHLIYTDYGYFSFADEGLLDPA
jgi:DNA repair protein RadC